MRILAIADVEEALLWDFFDRDYIKEVDLILSAGDLKRAYLEFLVTMLSCPLLYVHGNHDARYVNEPPEGCICIEDMVYDFNGLRILGLGGSMRYKSGPFMYNESEMKRRVIRATPGIAMKNGFDILLAHSPMRGYGDLDDLPHVGYSCFDSLVSRWHPKLMIHGHVHKAYGHFKAEREHPSGARLINACGHVFIDLPEDAYPREGRTGSPLYDLSVRLRKLRGKKQAW